MVKIAKTVSVLGQKQQTCETLLAISVLKSKLAHFPSEYRSALDFLIQKYCLATSDESSATYWSMIEIFLGQVADSRVPGFVKLEQDLRAEMWRIISDLGYDGNQDGFATLIGTGQGQVSHYRNHKRPIPEPEIHTFALNLCLRTRLGNGIVKQLRDDSK